MKKAISILLAVVLACAMMAPAMAADDALAPYRAAHINWRQFEGATINCLLVEHFATSAILAYKDEFEELTGITLNLDIIPESDYQNKLSIQNATGIAPEVYMENYPLVPAHYTSGLASDMFKYLDDAKLTDKDWYRYDDIFASVRDYAEYQGRLPGLPITAEYQMLFYRTDLFEEAGVKVPETLEEMYEAAVKLNNPEKNISGIVSRFKKSNGLDSVFGNYYANFGGHYVNEETRQTFYNTDEMKAAAEYYTRLMRDAAPAGIINYGWSECIAEVNAGTAAMFPDSSGFVGQMVDPATSAYADKIGFAPMPKGVNAASHVNCWMLGIGATSEKPEAAWLFVQWATSPVTVLKAAMRSGNATRYSAFEDAAFNEKFDNNNFKSAVLESEAIADRFISPQINEVSELASLIENALHAIYGGADVSATMDETQALATGVMNR